MTESYSLSPVSRREIQQPARTGAAWDRLFLEIFVGDLGGALGKPQNPHKGGAWTTVASHAAGSGAAPPARFGHGFATGQGAGALCGDCPSIQRSQQRLHSVLGARGR